MTDRSEVSLSPGQVCFVVDDVKSAVEECVRRFGWGPFHEFSAPVDEARYHDWTGPKRTDVALGMAGRVQVELIHVHEGHDTVEAYQSRYGAGFQHLGVHCADRDAALDALVALGGVPDDVLEFTGLKIAFVDTPTGPGLFELLQPTGTEAPPGASDSKAKGARKVRPEPNAVVDRATIVTRDLEGARAFHAAAFGWGETESSVEDCTLRMDGVESRVRRVRGQAGRLLLELIEPDPASEGSLYTRHLSRGDHGLVHAGGVAKAGADLGAPISEGEWLDDGELFSLYEWAGSGPILQIRSTAE